jgi:hypothetical protein
MRRLIPLVLFALSVWVVSCALDAPSDSRQTIGRIAGPNFIPVPCDENPTDPACNPEGGGGGGGGTLPPCSSFQAIPVNSATPATDSSIAATMFGPYQVSNCTGPTVWTAAAQGTSQPVHYQWYVLQCATTNYCDGPFTLFAEGVGLDSVQIPIGPAVRAQFTYVQVHEAIQPNYRSGVSQHQQTRGPAWGAEGTGSWGPPCFSDDYPLAWVDWRVDNTEQPPDSYEVWRWYSRNYCTGKKQFDSTRADTVGRDP